MDQQMKGKREIGIARNVRIAGGDLLVDGCLEFHSPEKAVGRVCRDIYRHLGIDYPKFYKMSALSKLGFLAAEVLLRDVNMEALDPGRFCLSLANASSSLHTDHIYQQSISEKPSPATFVYTLPNILIGEICIRHSIYGEGLFYIEENFSKDFVMDQAMELLKEDRADGCVAGWVDVDMEGKYLADLDLLLYIQHEKYLNS